MWGVGWGGGWGGECWTKFGKERVGNNGGGREELCQPNNQSYKTI